MMQRMDPVTVRPFRFGVVVGQPGDLSQWPRLAGRLEELGYAVLLVPDTLATPSPFPILAAAAAATTTLRLGSWVLAAPYRTAGATLRETAALQALSGGRFELGIGAGRPGGERDAQALGVHWGTPRERVDQVARTIQAVLGAVSPAPRVVVAAAGTRMLRIAGAQAQTIALAVSPMADAATVTASAHRARTAAGPRGPEIELSLQIIGVGHRVPHWISQQMSLSADQLADAGAVGLLDADPEEAAAQLRRLRATAGISYLTVPGQFAEALAPVVQQLAGTVT